MATDEKAAKMTVRTPGYRDPRMPETSILDATAQLAYDAEGKRLCGLGHHAWMPWLPITRDDGLLLRYETYCVRCRHPEQFDV